MKIDKDDFVFTAGKDRKFFRIEMESFFGDAISMNLTKENCEELIKELREYVEEDAN